MIICSLVVLYYFCFKACAKGCDKCFNCVKNKLVIDVDAMHNTQSIKEFIDIEHPDWYFPRLPGCIEGECAGYLYPP